MPNPAFKTRFAPSPTGLLHLGNIRTALFNVLAARARDGVFLLRIEDTDPERSRDEYTQALMRDLRWLGLDWQEGPEVGGAQAPYAQSQRGEIYANYARRLEAMGRAYPCFCTEQELKLSRKTQLASGRAPRYSGRCRGLSADEVATRLQQGTPASLRFRVPASMRVEFNDCVRGAQAFASDDIGDFIIRRSDGTPAFFFTNAIDDALMQVSLVVRGEDHLTNTPRQILLLQALALPVPEYAHIALVVGADGTPLSKRHGSRTVQEMRESGFFPLAINNYLARVGHTYSDNRFMSMTELAQGFDMARLGRAPARFDATQLLHWQREAILHASSDALWQWMGADVHALVPVDARGAFIDTVRANIVAPEQALSWARIVFTDDWELSATARGVIQQAGEGFFARALEFFDRHATDFKGLSDELKVSTGAKGKALFQPLRAALTGELDGPEMARLLPLITATRARQRLQNSLTLAR